MKTSILYAQSGCIKKVSYINSKKLSCFYYGLVRNGETFPHYWTPTGISHPIEGVGTDYLCHKTKTPMGALKAFRNLPARYKRHIIKRMNRKCQSIAMKENYHVVQF
jgi:hypothetical protein